PVWSRDDRLPRAQGIRECSGYSLCLVTVRSDINVGRTNQRSHFLRTEEPVVEDHVLLNSQLLGQGLQLEPVSITLAMFDLRVSRTCDDVDNVAVPGQDLWQGLNHVFESLVWRQQAEREQCRISFG